jgi:hypothetical protein
VRAKNPKRIFSGNQSKDLWRAINAVKEPDGRAWNTWSALYTLGCRCQELEARVEKLEVSK